MRWWPDGREERLMNDHPYSGQDRYAVGVGADGFDLAWGYLGDCASAIAQVRAWKADGQPLEPSMPDLAEGELFSAIVLAVNPAGVATGYYNPSDDLQVPTRLSLEGGTVLLPNISYTRLALCQGQAINAHGDIGGVCMLDGFVDLPDTAEDNRAAIWPTSDGVFDLNTVAVPPTGWRFVTVRGISNDGVLVGIMALDTNSVIRRGFLANGGVPMLPQWLARCMCRLLGHSPDTVERGAHVFFDKRPSMFGDSDKTRCTWCHTTLYVRYRRRGRRWISPLRGE
jgi:hypothetical protein